MTLIEFIILSNVDAELVCKYSEVAMNKQEEIYLRERLSKQDRIPNNLLKQEMTTFNKLLLIFKVIWIFMNKFGSMFFTMLKSMNIYGLIQPNKIYHQMEKT
jgi:hypothetical protein